MNVLMGLIGAVTLLAGRRLFWFFVGVVGFVAGLSFAPRIFTGQSDWVILLISLGLGVLGAILSSWLQRLAVAAAGFLTLGTLAAYLLGTLSLENKVLDWTFFIAGGLIGAALALLVLDWAIIIFSSILGSALIVNQLNLDFMAENFVAAGLFVLGVAVQAGLLVRSRSIEGGEAHDAQ